MRCAVALCSCDATRPLDGETLQRWLELDAAPERFDRLPDAGMLRFIDWLRRERPDRVVVGCCAAPELVREATRAAGVPANAVEVLNLPADCFRVEPDPASANAKAARLLRAAMRTVSTVPPAPGIPVRVGPTVLIAGDSPAAVALAQRLGSLAEPLLILDERLLRVDGALGAFRVTLEHQREAIPAGQVVVVGGNGDGVAGARPTRTGYHRLTEPSPATLDALSAKILGLIGEFEKPTYVRYDASTCAGGAAGHEACGRCVTACPYEAVARDPDAPLRIAVDQAACEGCGACVAVCPTSSLTFTDPPTALLDARLRGLLAPLPGVPSPPLIVAYHCPVEGAAARRSYPATVLPVPMACLRHVSEADILTAFRYGAAGVALIGCAACPHGERRALLERIALVRTVLDGFGVGGQRIDLIAASPGETTLALERFAAALAPSPVRWPGDGIVPTRGRDAIAEALRTLIVTSGREPGRTPVPTSAAFAVPDVRAAGCTVCRTCVNVCPTHAFRFEESRQALELKTIACVNCGLCAAACPESVITLRPEIGLDRTALDYTTVVQDEMLKCTKCGTAFANRRAVEIIEAKLFGMANLLDTFAGARRNLLRMCPNCRAVAAVAAMQEGWKP